MSYGSKVITEFLENGVLKQYDACSSNSLEYALVLFRNGFEYIGSGFKTYINGQETEHEIEYHFFIKIK